MMSSREYRESKRPRNYEGEFGNALASASTSTSAATTVDWTNLPDDTIIHLFSLLNLRDRASLASSCRAWRRVGRAECLWNTLDLRAYRFNVNTAVALASRCSSLTKLRFRGGDSTEALISLRASKLREISVDYCIAITDGMLSVIATHHEHLETLVLGPDFCSSISTDAFPLVAMCCPNLRRLRLSGVSVIDSHAINALAGNCPNLIEVGFIDCEDLNLSAIANITSLRSLSVGGTTSLNWDVASHLWSQLPYLNGLDVSRTNIGPKAVSRLLSSSSLRVFCALNCTMLENNRRFVMRHGGGRGFSKGKLLVSVVSDIILGIVNLLNDNSMRGKNVFSDWRDWRGFENKDERLKEIMTWFEWTLSISLLQITKREHPRLDSFWVDQGATLLLGLMQSYQEDVQEMAATRLAILVDIDNANANIDPQRAEVVLRGGGVSLLLRLARSWREGLQVDSAKAIASLSVNSNVAKALANEEGITILANLARSTDILVVEEAAKGLWNLSARREHMGAMVDAGAVKSIIDLILKWSTGGVRVLELADRALKRAAGALANLAKHEKYSIEVARAGGIPALVMLVQIKICKFEEVKEQAARALANLVAHDSAVGQEPIEAFVQLTHSNDQGARKAAACALWNLAFDDRNREAIARAGGVEALVALAKFCANASPGLQECAAGALWELSASEVNSIAIGREGGVAPLITLAKSEAEDVHERAAGALWNLAFNPGNALRIVEEGGVPALVHLCSNSVSKMARFMAALALAYMFDGRVDEVAMVGTSSESLAECISLDGTRGTALNHIEAFVLTFSDPQAFAAAAASSAPAALAHVTEAARIQEAEQLRCSGAEIGRIVGMLSNSSPILKAFAAFVLLQFTIPSGRHAPHHAKLLLQNAGTESVLRAAAEAGTAPLEANNIFARIALHNLEHHMLQIPP